MTPTGTTDEAIFEKVVHRHIHLLHFDLHTSRLDNSKRCFTEWAEGPNEWCPMDDTPSARGPGTKTNALKLGLPRWSGYIRPLE